VGAVIIQGGRSEADQRSQRIARYARLRCISMST